MLYRYQEQRQYKAQLIRELQTRDNGLAQRSMRELMAHGWHADGSLRGRFLNYANLKQIYMAEANFTDCRLHQAHFNEAWMRDVKLTGAILSGADFTGAHRLKPSQLMQAYRLVGATMPDGARYDGRFNLAGDFESALAEGYEVNDPQSLADFYGVPPATYLYWQANPMPAVDGYWETLSAEEKGVGGRPFRSEEAGPHPEVKEGEKDVRLFMAGAVLTLVSSIAAFLLSWVLQRKWFEKG